MGDSDFATDYAKASSVKESYVGQSKATSDEEGDGERGRVGDSDFAKATSDEEGDGERGIIERKRVRRGDGKKGVTGRVKG